MKQNEENVKEVQGAETQKVKRKDSFNYAMKSMKGLIDKLERNQWATVEELKEMQKVHKKLIERYIGLEINLN